jgi:flagellum-specific ATP synthase
MPGCNTQAETDLVTRARRLLSTYEDMGELIRIGAYKHGSDPKVDEAIKYVPAIEAFLSQDKQERADLESGYAALARVLGVDWQAGQGAAASPGGGGPQPGAGASDAEPKTAGGKPIPPKNDLRRARRQKQQAAATGGSGA